jgi:hypothetical protein
VPERHEEYVPHQAPVRAVSGRTSRGGRLLAGFAGTLLVGALAVAALQPRALTPSAGNVVTGPGRVVAGYSPGPGSVVLPIRGAAGAPASASPPARLPATAPFLFRAALPTPPTSGPGRDIATADAPDNVLPATLRLAALLPGQSRTVPGSGPAPQFSPDGTRVVWGDVLSTWPDLEPVAQVHGDALGWGLLGSDPGLLVREPDGGFSVLRADGSASMAHVDLKPLYGVASTTWSPERDRLWVQSSDWPSNSVSLSDWTAGGRRIATVPDAHHVAAHVTASEDERWVAAWWDRCGASGCYHWISAGPSRAGTLASLESHGAGIIRTLSLDEQGRVSALVDRRGVTGAADQSAGIDFLAGGPRVPLSPVAENVHAWWRLDTGAYVIREGGNLERLDPFTGRRTVVSVPGGVDPADVLGVSPDGAWIAAWSAVQAGRVRFLASRGGPPDIDSALSFAPTITVTWAQDGRFALVGDGRPPTQTIVRFAVPEGPTGDR